MLYCLFIAFDSFFVIELILIDITEVIIGIAISRVDFYGFLIPFNALINFIELLIDNGSVIIGRMILRIALNTFAVILKRLNIVTHIIICDPH